MTFVRKQRRSPPFNRTIDQFTLKNIDRPIGISQKFYRTIDQNTSKKWAGYALIAFQLI